MLQNGTCESGKKPKRGFPRRTGADKRGGKGESIQPRLKNRNRATGPCTDLNDDPMIRGKRRKMEVPRVSLARLAGGHEGGKKVDKRGKGLGLCRLLKVRIKHANRKKRRCYRNPKPTPAQFRKKKKTNRIGKFARQFGFGQGRGGRMQTGEKSKRETMSSSSLGTLESVPLETWTAKNEPIETHQVKEKKGKTGGGEMETGKSQQDTRKRARACDKKRKYRVRR